ncbi:MAG: hypothetical protein AAGF60_16905 [Pseudomonadota bacterium]
MKPSFALSLSFEGIRLLHRAAGGWRRVGEAGLSGDMNADLARLRNAADRLSPGDVTTKLIIPNDQIKYLTLETGAVGTPAREDAARAALDGATPYSVDELAFDICEDGPRTHVAAVARDTLDEAEAFAKLHKFAPVCFVSVPGEAGFLGEPFFGVTHLSETLLPPGEMVEPDGIAVVEIGPALPPAQKGGKAKTAPPSDPKPDAPQAKAKPAAEDKPAAAPAKERPAVKAKAEAAEKSEPPVKAPAPSVEAEAAPTAPAKLASADETVEAAPPKPDVTSAQVEPTPPAPSVTAPTVAAPSLPGAAPHAPDESAKPAPPVTAAPPDDTTGAPPPGFATRRTTTPPTPRPAPLAPKVPQPALRPSAAPALDIRADAARSLGHGEDIAADVAAPPAPRTGFLSRRRKPAAPSPIDAARRQEAQRMTVFGARQPAGAEAVGGKPRFLGLILTAILLVFLAGIAAWASVFLDDGLARLLPRDPEPRVASLPDTALPKPDEEEATVADPVALAALDPSLPSGLTEEDEAVLDALQDPLPGPQEALPPRTRAEAEARYAVTGIWPLAPDVPQAGPMVELDTLYVTSIDPATPAPDAVILASRADLDTDLPLPPRALPAPAGTRYALDEQGRIVPTEDGVETPDGFTLFAGRPLVEPPTYPEKAETAPQADAEDAARLAAFRPRSRPGDLVEQTERATLGGLTRSELAQLRPRLRPVTEKEEAEAAAEDQPASQFAAAQSLRPSTRPRNFERIVRRATRAPRTEETRTAAVAPRTVTPSIPSSASVARSATVRNAINLRRVNLIGVYGTPSARRALVRLSNGRYRKVKVGDRIDGGQVSAIGESELRYRKGGRNLVLKMPRS